MRLPGSSSGNWTNPAYCCDLETELVTEKPWYHEVKRYLEAQEYPEGASVNDKKFLRRFAAKFFLSNTILLVHLNSGAIFIFPPANLHYYILYIVFILCTIKAHGPVGNGAVGKGYRTWVQIPGPPIFHIILIYMFRRTHKAKGPPCALRIQPLDLQMARSKGHHMKDHHTAQSTHSTRTGRPTWINLFWAKKCYPHPQNYLQSRPNFLFLFFLYYFI